MGDTILYLDSRQSRAVMKALRKHGTVDHAQDINQALLLMAEKDFAYFFVDADTPQAHAFLKHLQHDPTLPPPSGVVLLTDNEEEDCEAWSVDTFINRGRIQGDVPRVFSHQKVERSDDANVLRLAEHANGRRIASGEKTEGGWGGTPPETEARVDETFNLRRRDAGSNKTEYGFARDANRRYRYIFVAVLILALGLWLFVWGPFASNSQVRRRADSHKVAAESPAKRRERKSNPETLPSVPVGYANSSATPAQSAPPAVVAESPAATKKPAAAASPPRESGDTSAATQQQPAVNHPPTVGISGPTQVTARQTAAYTASGSDPDGDGIAYSWGGSTTSRSWSTPGLYTVSVTVTDSRGMSAGASISVRVI